MSHPRFPLRSKHTLPKRKRAMKDGKLHGGGSIIRKASALVSPTLTWAAKEQQ